MSVDCVRERYLDMTYIETWEDAQACADERTAATGIDHSLEMVLAKETYLTPTMQGDAYLYVVTDDPVLTKSYATGIAHEQIEASFMSQQTGEVATVTYTAPIDGCGIFQEASHFTDAIGSNKARAEKCAAAVEAITGKTCDVTMTMAHRVWANEWATVCEEK